MAKSPDQSGRPRGRRACHIPYGIACWRHRGQGGHQVQIYDANAWRKASTSSSRCAPRTTGTSSASAASQRRTVLQEDCEIAKRVSPTRYCSPAAGSSRACTTSEVDPQIDVGCVGEAFVSFPGSRRHRRGRPGFSKINGLAYRGSAANASSRRWRRPSRTGRAPYPRGTSCARHLFQELPDSKRDSTPPSDASTSTAASLQPRVPLLLAPRHHRHMVIDKNETASTT